MSSNYSPPGSYDSRRVVDPKEFEKQQWLNRIDQLESELSAWKETAQRRLELIDSLYKQIDANQKLVMKLAEKVRFEQQDKWQDALDTDEVNTDSTEQIINKAKKELGL